MAFVHLILLLLACATFPTANEGIDHVGDIRGFARRSRGLAVSQRVMSFAATPSRLSRLCAGTRDTCACDRTPIARLVRVDRASRRSTLKTRRPRWLMMASAQGGEAEDDEDIDWGKVNPKDGQTPDWDKILPKGREAVEMPPEPEAFSGLEPKERLQAYAGMLDWTPMDLDEEDPPEKTYEDLSQEMQDEYLSNQLQSALRKNRNVEKNVNKWYISQRLDEEREDLEKTAQALKEQYAKDAKRIQKEVMEEFDKGARVMDINIANIIARGRVNFTRSTGPLSETTPFPAAIAAEFADLAEDQAAFYEELGVAPPPEGTPRADIMTTEERNQIEAELRTLNPRDVVKAASAQAAALAQRNASEKSSAIRRAAEAAGSVVVIGSTDGDLGGQIMTLFESEAEGMGGKGAARVSTVAGVSLADARALTPDVKRALEGAKTLVIVPADAGSKAGGKGGGGLGGFFGGGGSGGSGGGGASAGASLSDEEATRLLKAGGQELKHVVCLSVGGASGGGRGGFFGGGGGGDPSFPAESATEQAVIRLAKSKGLSYTTVRVAKLGDERRADPAPLITPKNAPRPKGKLPDASRSVVANTILRASYQPEARRNSTFAVSDFPTSPGAWPVPASGWADEFVKLQGPELLRVAIPAEFEGGSGTFKAWAFLREWVQLWTREGTGLTTRVKIFVDEDSRRTGLYFDPSQKPYLSAKEEKEAEAERAAKAKAKGASGPPSKAKNMLAKEGGVDIVVEDKPYPRVRAVRANMGPKTVVKEMSEQLILDRLKKDIRTFITDRKGR